MSRNLQTVVWLCASACAVALGRTLPLLFAGGLPQAPGENVLALVLGDARQELSVALLDKTEEYFHGGVREVACEHGMGCPDGEHTHEHGAARQTPAPPARAVYGPSQLWRWINARVHEQTDRHVESERAEELLPWVWAACRASPKNIEAFQVGSYVLTRMVGRPEAGVQLLEEGVRHNPACAELDFALGELLLNKAHDAARAEPWFLSARAKCRPAEGPAGEEARLLAVRTLLYLGALAKQRGDWERVGLYAREAEALVPGHVCAQRLRAMLQARP